jgi:hypothetical protein
MSTARKTDRPGVLELELLGVALLALVVGVVILYEGAFTGQAALVVAFGGSVLLLFASVVVIVRVAIPALVVCGKACWRAYVFVRPSTALGRVVVLSTAVLAAVGGLYLGVSGLLF